MKRRVCGLVLILPRWMYELDGCWPFESVMPRGRVDPRRWQAMHGTCSQSSSRVRKLWASKNQVSCPLGHVHQCKRCFAVLFSWFWHVFVVVWSCEEMAAEESGFGADHDFSRFKIHSPWTLTEWSTEFLGKYFLRYHMYLIPKYVRLLDAIASTNDWPVHWEVIWGV